jgi:hypothetical protein
MLAMTTAMVSGSFPNSIWERTCAQSSTLHPLDNECGSGYGESLKRRNRISKIIKWNLGTSRKSNFPNGIWERAEQAFVEHTKTTQGRTRYES